MKTLSNPDPKTAEESLIGTLLLAAEEDTKSIIAGLDKKYFADPTCAKVYESLKNLSENNYTTDVLNLEQRHNLDRVTLLSLISKASLAESVKSAKRLILDNWIKRSVEDVCKNIATYLKKDSSGSSVIDGIQNMLDEHKEAIAEETSTKNMEVLLTDYMNELANPKSVIYKVNVTNLKPTMQNELPILMKAGHLVSVVARAKSGKTTMMLQMALDAEKQGCDVLIFSLEMSAFEIVNKLMAYETNVSPIMLDISDSETPEILVQERAKNVRKGIEGMQNKKISMSRDKNLHKMKSRIIEFARKTDRGIVFIDQLQFIQMAGKFFSIQDQYEKIINELKAIAVEQEITIVLAHQMNRDIVKREGKYPIASDIKNSGKVEEGSDLVIMFQCPDGETTRYCTTVSRHGPGQRYELPWSSNTASFITPQY